MEIVDLDFNNNLEFGTRIQAGKLAHDFLTSDLLNDLSIYSTFLKLFCSLRLGKSTINGTPNS